MSACAAFTTASDVEDRDAAPAGSTGPAPAVLQCGDTRVDAANCGFCGHACGAGETCTDGVCPVHDVLRAKGIRSFATDGGPSVFYVDGATASVCEAGTCRPIVHAETVGAVMAGKPPTLAPRAVAMTADRVVIADDGAGAVLSCPTNKPCTAASLGVLVDGNVADGPFKALAVGPSGVAWSRGDVLRGSLFPPGGSTLPAFANARTDATRGIARVLGNAVAGVLWVGAAGVFRAEIVGGPAERLSARTGNDLATDGRSAVLATDDGLYRIGLVDVRETLAAEGAFVRVVADARSTVAAKREDGVTKIVDVRGGAAYELARADDLVALALVGEDVFFATPTRIARVRR